MSAIPRPFTIIGASIATPVSVPNGGTGAATFAANNILTGNTTSAIQASGVTLVNSSGAIALTGSTGNFTITAGTGNSRLLLLQSTTAGGAAATFLTGNADQSATFANAVTVPTLLNLTSTSGSSTGGIAFSTDVFLYRASATDVALAGTGLATIFFNRSATLGGFFNSAAGNGTGAYFNGSTFIIQTAAATALTLDASQNAQFAKLVTSYNGSPTAGNGVSTVQGAGRVTAQVAAVASIATYTVGGSDASFIVSGNVLVTASATHTFSLECAYTDEGNTARTVTFNVQQLGGTLITSITNVTGIGPYEGVPLHIRAKSNTAITIRTNAAGTYTSVAFNAEGVIQKLQ